MHLGKGCGSATAETAEAIDPTLQLESRTLRVGDSMMDASAEDTRLHLAPASKREKIRVKHLRRRQQRKGNHLKTIKTACAFPVILRNGVQVVGDEGIQELVLQQDGAFLTDDREGEEQLQLQTNQDITKPKNFAKKQFPSKSIQTEQGTNGETLSAVDLSFLEQYTGNRQALATSSVDENGKRLLIAQYITDTELIVHNFPAEWKEIQFHVDKIVRNPDLATIPKPVLAQFVLNFRHLDTNGSDSLDSSDGLETKQFLEDAQEVMQHLDEKQASSSTSPPASNTLEKPALGEATDGAKEVHKQSRPGKNEQESAVSPPGSKDVSGTEDIFTLRMTFEDYCSSCLKFLKEVAIQENRDVAMEISNRDNGEEQSIGKGSVAEQEQPSELPRSTFVERNPNQSQRPSGWRRFGHWVRNVCSRSPREPEEKQDLLEADEASSSHRRTVQNTAYDLWRGPSSQEDTRMVCTDWEQRTIADNLARRSEIDANGLLNNIQHCQDQPKLERAPFFGQGAYNSKPLKETACGEVHRIVNENKDVFGNRLTKLSVVERSINYLEGAVGFAVYNINRRPKATEIVAWDLILKFRDWANERCPSLTP
ncbi:unnamed protein product [Amoebophrya sp. A120]|nr:unnamed protein product [Amoebophrya sp. A120]|eukprot:GSA120T00021976001.1